MKTIEIIVSSAGMSTVVTKGFAGSDCQQASRFLEKTLGKEMREQLTPEFYAVQNTRQSNIEQR